MHCASAWLYFAIWDDSFEAGTRFIGHLWWQWILPFYHSYPYSNIYNPIKIAYFTNYMPGPRTSSIQTALLFLALFLHFHLFLSRSQLTLHPTCWTGNSLAVAASLSHGGKALQQPCLRSSHGGYRNPSPRIYIVQMTELLNQLFCSHMDRLFSLICLPRREKLTWEPSKVIIFYPV